MSLNLDISNIPIRVLNVDSFVTSFVLIVDPIKKILLPLDDIVGGDYNGLKDRIISLEKKYKQLSPIVLYQTFLKSGDLKSDSKNIEEFWRNLEKMIRCDNAFHITNEDFTPIEFSAGPFEKWSIIHTNITSATPNNFPAWDEFLDRVDPQMKDYFLAWIWAVYISDSSRLVCWLQGAGDDGKSTIVDILMNNLSFLATSVSHFDPNDKFLTSQLVGRKLIYLPDQDDQNLIESGLMKSITGQDTIKIERKFGQATNKKITAKVLVTSNPEPKIKDSRASRTRFMLVRVSKIENISKPLSVWTSELQNEFPSFLLTCKQNYERIVGVKERLTIPEVINEALVTNSLSINALNLEDYIQQKIKFSPSNKVHLHDVLSSFNRYCESIEWKPKEVQILHAQLKNKLIEKGAVLKQNVRINKDIRTGFIGIEVTE